METSRSAPTLEKEKDYYSVLNLDASSDVTAVERAYWHQAWAAQAAARTDPWACQSLEELNEAYSVLGTPALRAEYDHVRPCPLPQQQTEQEPRAPMPGLPLLVAGMTLAPIRKLRRLSSLVVSAWSRVGASWRRANAPDMAVTFSRPTRRRQPAIDPADLRAVTAKTGLARGRVKPQPTYTEAEVKRLLLVCDATTPESLRNRALLLVLFDTGVRKGELVSMGLPDWERRRVRVSGKTGVRDVPLGMAALQALERYVRRWGISEPPLWRGKKGPLTGSGVLQVVRRLSRQAGVPHKGVHAFRRAAAAQMKRLGMNDSDILEVLGWRDITMLRRYTSEVAEELAHAAHSRHSPGDALKMR